MTEISLQNPRRYRSLRTEQLSDWLQRLIESVAPETTSFAVRFVGDEEMRLLNSRYRGRDRATDVLSFPGEESPEGRHLGDLVISIPTARRQADAHRVSEHIEIRGLLLHGVLHCLGYDHESDDGEMDALEERLRREWMIDDVD